MKIVYSPRYAIDIGPHVYLTEKYRRIHARLLAAPHAHLDGTIEPEPATWNQLALVHTDEYLDKVRTLTLASEELRELQLPLNESVVEGFRLMTGGTLTAACLAPADGVAVHIGGGFHHGFANHGEGFCLFHDVAVTIEVLRQEGSVSAVAVVDLDVHHGNGTAMIYGMDSAVFTFSMHEQHNYPVFKPRGSLDISWASVSAVSNSSQPSSGSPLPVFTSGSGVGSRPCKERRIALSTCSRLMAGSSSGRATTG